MIVIPTWTVLIYSDDENSSRTFRVPETRLNDFLSVLTFNKLEFTVEKEMGFPGVIQVAS